METKSLSTSSGEIITATSRPNLPRFLKHLCKSAASWASASTTPARTWSDQAVPSPGSKAETSVKALWESLTNKQKEVVCFDWDYTEKKRGLLRTFVANHWQITRPCIRSDFFTKKQQWIIHDIFRGLINADWYARFLRQLKEDTFGHEWGADQSIAIFGAPYAGKFQFVICGRHLTLRADGCTEGRLAFGGPILYGHAASGVTEERNHPGNIFWFQAEKANKVYRMLDHRQQTRALASSPPAEERVVFQGMASELPGLPVADMSDDQKKELREVLQALVEPFRAEDQESVHRCLQKQGGLEKCTLIFYTEGNLANDGVWDNWRLEGPAFVWYFRGAPHVHVWVHVANDPAVELNASNGVFLDPSHDPLGAWPKGSPPPGAF
jgi:hypothetical protein